jgi:hypothetical protein
MHNCIKTLMATLDNKLPYQAVPDLRAEGIWEQGSGEYLDRRGMK